MVAMILTNELIEKYGIKPRVICYIGANQGQELPDMLNSFPDSNIHCFEPQKVPFNLLKKKFGNKQNLYFYNFALGNQNKKITIYTNNNNDYMSSSILEPKEHLLYHKQVTFEGSEEIELKRFDDLNIQNVDYLNIDVQGFELEVLKGFNNLNEIKYIKTEVNRKELYKNCVLVKELDKYLDNYNFIRVKTVWWQSTVPWGDAFYIKKDLVANIIIIFSKLKNNIQNIKGYFWILSKLIKIKNFNNDKLEIEK